MTCALAFFLAPAIAFVLGARPEPFENRALHEFPDPGSGWSFFTGLSKWATDHLPLREAGIRAASGISTGVFGDPPAAGTQSRGGTVGVSPHQDQPSDIPPAELFPKVITGKNGWLYLGEDITGKCLAAMDVDQVVAALNELRRAVESSGRRFELVVAPDKSTVVPEHLPDDYVGKDCSQRRARAFWQRIPTEAGAIDLRPALAESAARLGRPLYDPRDSHWTFAGGLTMTKAVLERIEPGSTSSWKVSASGFRPWPADLLVLLGQSGERRLHTYALAPDGSADRTRYIASDFRTPLRVRQPSLQGTTGTTEDSVGVIADSFTQFATPFLAAAVPDLMIAHVDTVAEASPDRLADMLVDRDVVVVEFVERIVAGGGSALLRDDVIGRIADVLARNPR
ncbi:acetyltransferase AlgX (SGNH hydrolase-like protein) [Prauserella shujinwangii]|uniref:Acetyltransferase AlgX (SGNH hydrolase-like protein) n=1 Tax=Prauserella shujinwangii TaxID=1453103 RepID=A0A2T0LVG7_9PSEU|nr:acetyltransferase AlgX (SGNH hydrolase-like protein) [Prauserella shujinwangii]